MINNYGIKLLETINYVSKKYLRVAAEHEQLQEKYKRNTNLLQNIQRLP